MSMLLPLAAALLPPLLMMMFIIRQDPVPEPTEWLRKAFLAGVAICLPVSLVEIFIQGLISGGTEATTLLDTTIDAFFVAALPEESFKLLALWLVLRRNPYFDEHFDGIVYAVCVGLGFAALENVLYVMDEEDWLTVAVMRALLSVPGHYAFAVIMGYYYSIYHFVDRSPLVGACTLLVPVVAHGIYDALALSSTVNPYVGGVAFVVLIYFCYKMHKFARAKALAQIERDYRDRV